MSKRMPSSVRLVCLDFWTAEDRKQISVHVLVITDHFMKLAHAKSNCQTDCKEIVELCLLHIRISAEDPYQSRGQFRVCTYKSCFDC